MINTDTITVYWSPAKFFQEEDSWNGLYAEPMSIQKQIMPLVDKTLKDKEMLRCPAYLDSFKNVYSINSTIDDNYIIPKEILNLLKEEDFANGRIQLPTNINKIQFHSHRKSIFSNFYDITYNMSVVFVADEPLIATFTPPYFPPKSVGEGVYLTTGEFDIGQWFRPYNLNYLIPDTTNQLSIKKDDPLFYIKFNTNKKIIFKRFIHTKKLHNLTWEFMDTNKRYETGNTLINRYKLAKRTKMFDIALSEIKKNLVD